MADSKKACPCSRPIEDVADAIAIVGDMHGVIMQLFDTRMAALNTMEQHRIASGAEMGNFEHPLIIAMEQTQQELHALHILVRASGVMTGIPDVADLNWEDAEAAFHGPDLPQEMAAVPPKTTKH